MYNVGSNPNACAELLAAEPSVWEEAMATLETMQEIIKTKNGGDWIIYYPHQIGAARVYEIWTSNKASKADEFKIPPDHTPQTRFLLEDENGSQAYFNYFEGLAEELNKRLKSAEGADLDLAIKRETESLRFQKISLYVASFAFIAAVCAVIIWLFTGKGENALIIAALTGLITAGGAYYMKSRPPAQH
jgi:hypothetical protein